VLQLKNLLSSFARSTGVNVSEEFATIEAEAIAAAETRIAAIESRVPDVVAQLEAAAAPEGPIVQALVHTSAPLIANLVQTELQTIHDRLAALEGAKA
jgi:hypothetical protein